MASGTGEWMSFKHNALAMDCPFPGDYNDDDFVDAADYVAWRKNVGEPAGTLPNDIDGGTIGPPQYDTWRAQSAKRLAQERWAEATRRQQYQVAQQPQE